MAGFVSVNGETTSVFEGCLFGVVTGVWVVAGATFVVSVLVDGTDTSPNFLEVGIFTAGLPMAETMAAPPFGMPRLVCCSSFSSGVVVSGDGRVSVGVLGLLPPPEDSSLPRFPHDIAIIIDIVSFYALITVNPFTNNITLRIFDIFDL